MEAEDALSPLDLFALPDLQRDLLVYLVRHGPAEIGELAAAAGVESSLIDVPLGDLVSKGRVRLLPGGWAEAITGRVHGRKTLPAQLWHALQTSDRLYTEQDIATLRTAIPILQFARARMVEFADHGPGHALRVKSYASQLGHVMGLNPTEQGLLRAAALFHDVGNAVARERHNILSQETVIRLTADGELPFSAAEAEVVGLLCRWHRSEYDPNRADTLAGTVVRTGLLASILRVADAMDIDQRRSDYSDRFFRMLQFFFPAQLPFWTSLKEILGVRVCSRRMCNFKSSQQGKSQSTCRSRCCAKTWIAHRWVGRSGKSLWMKRGRIPRCPDTKRARRFWSSRLSRTA